MGDVKENIEIYTKSDKFKYGWVASFYDALSDDGLRYFDDILRYGARDGDQQSFMAGYRAGQRARRGAAIYNPEPMMATLLPAA